MIEAVPFGRNSFSMIGLLNRKSSDFRYCVETAYIVFFGHRSIHRVPHVFSSRVNVWVGYADTNEIRKTWCTSEVGYVHSDFREEVNLL